MICPLPVVSHFTFCMPASASSQSSLTISKQRGPCKTQVTFVIRKGEEEILQGIGRLLVLYTRNAKRRVALYLAGPSYAPLLLRYWQLGQPMPPSRLRMLAVASHSQWQSSTWHRQANLTPEPLDTNCGGSQLSSCHCASSVGTNATELQGQPPCLHLGQEIGPGPRLLTLACQSCARPHVGQPWHCSQILSQLPLVRVLGRRPLFWKKFHNCSIPGCSAARVPLLSKLPQVFAFFRFWSSISSSSLAALDSRGPLTVRLNLEVVFPLGFQRALRCLSRLLLPLLVALARRFRPLTALPGFAGSLGRL
jgi:hypothetical protein